jgi:hypothetical protein
LNRRSSRLKSWARNGVLAHLKAPTADAVQAADDCSSVAALVCAAALVSRVDAVNVENTRRGFCSEGSIADVVSRLRNVVQLERDQLNDALCGVMQSLSDVVCAWPGVDLSAFEPLEGTYFALPDDAELIGESWVISTDSGSSTPLCPSTPAARAMRATLEAIELAVERVPHRRVAVIRVRGWRRAARRRPVGSRRCLRQRRRDDSRKRRAS